jgi:hypothetical protein
MLNPKQWERRPPGKTRRDPVLLQAADLARELGCGQNADPLPYKGEEQCEIRYKRWQRRPS